MLKYCVVISYYFLKFISYSFYFVVTIKFINTNFWNDRTIISTQRKRKIRENILIIKWFQCIRYLPAGQLWNMDSITETNLMFPEHNYVGWLTHRCHVITSPLIIRPSLLSPDKFMAIVLSDLLEFWWRKFKFFSSSQCKIKKKKQKQNQTKTTLYIAI